MRALRRRAMQWLCVVLLLGSQAPVGDQALASTARPITPVEVKPQLASIPNRLVSSAGVSDEGPWDNNFGIPGINGTVFAIAVTGTAVYIGGFFVTAGGVAANSIARWDRETNTWEALGNNLLGGGVGVNGVVSAIAVYGDDVYVGGGFDAVDGLSARSVAKWNDVTKQWSPMSGFPYPVDEIAVDSHGAVYVAGSVYVSNFPAPFACIQRWVGHAWTTGCRLRIELRPNEVAPFYGFRITALAVDKSDNVYVGGPASQIIDNVHMDGLAVWHGTWFPVPNREPNEVIDLAANGDEVYVLERLFSQPVNPYIDRLSTVAGGWSVLANFVPGGNSVIKSIAVSDAGNGADVYMGGRLTSINGVAVSNIAKWNSTTGQLSALATGIESNSPYIPVQALAIGEDAVYAGGDFTIAGGSTSNSIARWGRPTSLTVDTESNTQDGDTASVGALIANRGADGRISLPEAVTAVNNSNPGRTIKFDLPHGATIVLTETITLEASKTTIDGDVNGDAKPDVLIVGQAITPTLRVQSANNLIRNLAIKGLRLEGASAHDNRIANSYFGTDADGLAARPESGNGLEVASGASNNVIKNSIFAGNVNADPNINGAGLLIASGAHHNVVQGNRFGVNRVDAALPNEIGLAIVSGAQNNTIGGDWASTGCKDPCNLISGNQTVGLVLQGPGTMSNTVLGNLIGLNPAGSGPLPNEGSGIRLEAGASDNLIGGDHALKTCTGPCNVISGNQGAGVAIVGASQNRVQGNFIGLNLVGTGTLPNTASGVQVTGGAAFNIIGGLRTDNQCIGPCNLIGGNGQSGVVLEQTDTISNVVEGNYIGLGLTTIGFITMPNQLNGVTVAGGASLNLIGGIRPGEADCNGACNVISGNGGAGVLLADAGTTQNSVQGNFIGVNATRNVHMPNALSGVIANAATDNLIGGPRVPGACIGPCNVIAGNLGGGVWGGGSNHARDHYSWQCDLRERRRGD